MATSTMTTGLSVNKRLLVVGFSPAEQNTLQALLKDDDIQPVFKQNLSVAIDSIQESSSNEFQAYLIHENALNDSSFEEFYALKQQPKFQFIPIILQVLSSQSPSIEKCMALGLSFYLIQPYTAVLLHAVLSSSTQGFMNHLEINRRLTSFSNSRALLQQSVFHIQTPGDAQAVSSILSYLTPEPKRTSVGLFELMLNSIEHGNLEIGYDEKTKLVKNGLIQEEIQHRLTQDAYRDKFTVVTFERTDNAINITIADSGKGFDYAPFLSFEEGRAMEYHGRGILIANKFSFDSLEYQNHGATVVCKIDL